MNTLVLPIRYDAVGTPTVCTADFAEGLAIQHPSLMKTLREHLAILERDFGQVRFEIRTVRNGVGAVNEQHVAHLTEDQALFLGSLSRNSERVVEFKSVLVRSFAEARRRLNDLSRPSYQIEDPIERAKAWIREQQERQALVIENSELRPQAEYTQKVLDSSSTLTTTIIAKELDMRSAIKLNKLLAEKGVQFKQSGIWNLTARYAGKGYAKLSTFHHTGNDGKSRTEHLLVWTEKGRELIHRLLNPSLQLSNPEPV